ncbi:helix-turn-helix transcriptional regulator [Bacillus sp. FJAT-49736]|uniref:helix-turn-helix domain-containing protein n=1 Tax=Bacillus sp. FJAT-49736 TaxID=2833582 RepID=UPI001BCA41DB|nr:helix-turn-helix transcriptional regulator [Bacillus sp. FJAT-49736]MBS4175586.1 helix-turn-helix transcriptional regulator [Bacillus sp. FJAT-49736]
MLGERIRKLRKQKKMTLETLAGNELTKGMLSLIENNKAQPSMESLAFIAKQLEVDITDLLEEVSSQELREILERAENLYNMSEKERTNQYEQLIALISPYIDNLKQGYESARLLDIYSRALYYNKGTDWQYYLDRAADLYDQINLTANRANIGIFRSNVKFKEHNYAHALGIFLQERKEIEKKHAYIDPMSRLNLDYHEAILHFAVGDNNSAKFVMNNAIQFSKEQRIFYLIDDLYRLAAGQAMMDKNDDEKSFYLNKLKQYGEFADDSLSLKIYELNDVMSLISDKHDYIKALDKIERYFSSSDKNKILNNLYFLERGKALFGLCHYEEAINSFEKAEIPSTVHHPFDLSLYYVKDCYIALCYWELGHKNEAHYFAKTAMDNFTNLPRTPYKEFSQETYEKLRKYF